MEENNIVKYKGGIIKNVSNAINITSKLLSIAESETKKELEKELSEYLNENFLEGTRGYGDINYKAVVWGTKVVSVYLRKGVYKFFDIVKDIYARIGDKLKQVFKELKGSYSIIYVKEATEKQADKMDFNVRKITYESVVGNLVKEKE